MSDLTLRGIEKSFDASSVIRGVDLTVPHGAVTAILGPSGCGKTTLLRLIAGFDDPNAGVITLGNTKLYENGRSMPPEKRQIGFVVQEGALFPHLTVGENITFGLPRQQRHDASIVARLLKQVGLEAQFGRRYPHQLSGGQQQRVALARALAPEPSIILLDEPFSSLDSRLRESTRRAILETLRSTAATTVIVNHDQAEALSMADQVAVMDAGRFIDVGEPTRIYRRPATREVAYSTGDAIVLPATVRAGRATSALGISAVFTDIADGACEVMIRPEQLQICPNEQPGGIQAHVVESIFYGHEVVVQLRLDDGSSLPVRSTAHTIPVNGDVVGVRVTEPIHAFPVSPKSDGS
jgi:iron(III) transport system ATP-binding protein